MKNSFTGIGFKSVFAGGHTLVPASGEPVNLLCKLHSYRYLSLPPNQAPWGVVRENGNTSGVTMHPSLARVFLVSHGEGRLKVVCGGRQDGLRARATAD